MEIYRGTLSLTGKRESKQRRAHKQGVDYPSIARLRARYCNRRELN